MTITLPYLLLKVVCDKILSVGDVFVCGLSFLNIYWGVLVICLSVVFSFLKYLPRSALYE